MILNSFKQYNKSLLVQAFIHKDKCITIDLKK